MRVARPAMWGAGIGSGVELETKNAARNADGRKAKRTPEKSGAYFIFGLPRL